MQNFPFDEFRKLKVSFFTESARVPVPRDTDIADFLMEGMIKSHQITSEEQLHSWLEYPFFQKNIRNKFYFEQKLEVHLTERESGIDVMSIETAEEKERALKIKENEITKRIETEFQQEYDRKYEQREIELNEKEEQLRRLRAKTVLDSTDFPAPEEEKEIESLSNTPLPEWWDRLGLRGNPFPDTQGLLGWATWKEIDEMTYKSRIYLDYERKAQSNSSDLFQNTIVYGLYGSGKTHFFQYFKQKLGFQGYNTIYITFESAALTLREIFDDFNEDIFEQTRLIYQKWANQAIPPDPLDKRAALLENLRALAKLNIKGILVFIDQLHKFELQTALRFVDDLQSYSNWLKENCPGLKIAFYMSGTPEMERAIQNDPRIRGAISIEERMDPVTVDAALTVLNLRLKAFAKDPERPKQVSQKFVKDVFERITNPEMRNFREIITQVKGLFSQYKFDPLAVNPIDIPRVRLDLIKDLLEQNQRFKDEINKLMKGERLFRRIDGKEFMLTPEQKTVCLERLSELSRLRVIKDSKIPEQDRPYYKVLDQVGLIRSREFNSETYWAISPALDYQSKIIFERFNYQPEDYLSKIYGQRREIARPSKKNAEIAALDELLAKLPGGLIRDLVEKSKSLHIEIVDLQENSKALDASAIRRLLEKCTSSLAFFTKAYMTLEDLFFGSLDDSEIVGFWTDFWYEPAMESVGSFLRTMKLDYSEALPSTESVPRYREAFQQILAFFSDQFEKSALIPIPLADLKNEEILSLNQCRAKILEKEYATAVAEINRLVERKIRTFLFDSFTILYGPREERLKHVPKDGHIRGYIEEKLHEEDKENPSRRTQNEFIHLNRHQYKLLMTEGRQNLPIGRANWLHIFSIVFKPWSETQLIDYLDMFANANISTAHFKFDEEYQSLRMDTAVDLLRSSRTFLAAINRAYFVPLKKENFMEENGIAFLSFCNLSDKSELTQIKVDLAKVRDFVNDYKGRGPFKVRMDDQSSIRAIFNMEYREFFVTLAFLLSQTDDQMRKSNLRLSLVSYKGSYAVFELASIKEAGSLSGIS